MVRWEKYLSYRIHLTGLLEVGVQGVLLHTQYLASLLVKTPVLARKYYIFLLTSKKLFHGYILHLDMLMHTTSW